MEADRGWQFLAELVRQLDASEHATGKTVADSLDIARFEAENVYRALRRRGFIVELPSPQRLGDSILDHRLEATPDGIRAAASGRLRE